jgi:hypothetical protein
MTTTLTTPEKEAELLKHGYITKLADKAKYPDAPGHIVVEHPDNGAPPMFGTDRAKVVAHAYDVVIGKAGITSAEAALNKEQVHDTLISPLVSQIGAIAAKHGIACFMSFSIPTTEKPKLECTTATLDGEGKRPDKHDICLAIMREEFRIMRMPMPGGD